MFFVFSKYLEFRPFFFASNPPIRVQLMILLLQQRSRLVLYQWIKASQMSKNIKKLKIGVFLFQSLCPDLFNSLVKSTLLWFFTFSILLCRSNQNLLGFLNNVFLWTLWFLVNNIFSPIIDLDYYRLIFFPFFVRHLAGNKIPWWRLKIVLENPRPKKSRIQKISSENWDDE